jgi:hypothetical protein
MGRMNLARICVLSAHMANKSDGEFTPQELQRDGQSAIAQDAPLRELHQEGGAAGRKHTSARPTTPELIDEEVAVLCDIERDGLVGSAKQGVVESLAKRGLIDTYSKELKKGSSLRLTRIKS